MRRNPERTAWFVLWAAFTLCCFLAYLVPSGLRWFVQTAAADNTIRLTNSNTVYVQRPGRASLEANLTEVPVGSTISTETTAQASLTFGPANQDQTIASLTIYGDTQISIDRADSPRFANWSLQPHHLILRLTKGRLRVFTSAASDRTVEVQILSAPDTATLIAARGSNLSVEASFVGTTVTVREGEAQVTAQNQTLTLVKDQRADVTGAGPAGPLPAERDLIRDGDFQNGLSASWQVDVRPPADPNEDPGRARAVELDGRQGVNFQRVGQNWGQVGLAQDLNQDVRDFKSLRLQLDVYLSFQDLSNCGSQGTECPVMVKIRYGDTAGVEREWLQGFYYKYDANPVFGYTFCAPCSPRYADHLRVQQNQWLTFESNDLLEAMHTAGAPAAVLKTIMVYGSGHTFESNVAQIQLLASD